METVLSSGRRTHVLTVGFASLASLYLLMVSVAEPLRTLAATDTTTVSLDVLGSLSMSCTENVTLPPVPGGTATPGSGTTVIGLCTPITSGGGGYTLSWRVVTGSGAPALNCTKAAPCFGTGHMLGNNLTNGYPDVIQAFARNSHLNVPGRFDGTTITTGSGARWAARLMANSTTPGGGSVTWGSDSDTEGFLNVGTGNIVNIAKRLTETDEAGDSEYIKYKAYIPSGTFQPSGYYKVTVEFTVTDN